MSERTVPDLDARYSQPVADPWSAFLDHADGADKGRQSYRAHLGIDAIPGVSARAKATVQALWADADHGAIESGEPALVWTSAPTLAKRMGVSESTAWRGLRAAAAAGLVIRLSNYLDARKVWTKDRSLVAPTCRCEPGKRSTARNRDCCSCRVLVPVDRDGRVTMALTRSLDVARREHVSQRTKAAQDPVTGDRGSRILYPVKRKLYPVKGDRQPIPLGASQTLKQEPPKRSANTADTEPWYVAHRIEHAPWVDE